MQQEEVELGTQHQLDEILAELNDELVHRFSCEVQYRVAS